MKRRNFISAAIASATLTQLSFGYNDGYEEHIIDHEDIGEFLKLNSSLKNALIYDELPIFYGAEWDAGRKAGEKYYPLARYENSKCRDIFSLNGKHSRVDCYPQRGEEFTQTIGSSKSESFTMTGLKREILNKEDNILAKMLRASSQKAIKHHYHDIDKESINSCFYVQDIRDVLCENIVIHPSLFEKLKHVISCMDDNNISKSRILLCRSIKPNEIFFLPGAEYLGALPIENEELSCRGLKYIYTQRYGAFILNAYLITKLTIE